MPGSSSSTSDMNDAGGTGGAATAPLGGPGPGVPVRDGMMADEVFADRHIGPSPADVEAMLAIVGQPGLSALVDAIVPGSIRLHAPLGLGPAVGEAEALAQLAQLAARNRVFRSYIGMGYHATRLPNVIARNVLQNPAWYTAYTPYQAEISQGRMEALINFQTMCADLTGMEIANASLLDEGLSLIHI